MKKICALLLVLTMLMGCGAYAENMGLSDLSLPAMEARVNVSLNRDMIVYALTASLDDMLAQYGDSVAEYVESMKETYTMIADMVCDLLNNLDFRAAVGGKAALASLQLGGQDLLRVSAGWQNGLVVGTNLLPHYALGLQDVVDAALSYLSMLSSQFMTAAGDGTLNANIDLAKYLTVLQDYAAGIPCTQEDVQLELNGVTFVSHLCYTIEYNHVAEFVNTFVSLLRNDMEQLGLGQYADRLYDIPVYDGDYQPSPSHVDIYMGQQGELLITVSDNEGEVVLSAGCLDGHTYEFAFGNAYSIVSGSFAVDHTGFTGDLALIQNGVNTVAVSFYAAMNGEALQSGAAVYAQDQEIVSLVTDLTQGYDGISAVTNVYLYGADESIGTITEQLYAGSGEIEQPDFAEDVRVLSVTEIAARMTDDYQTVLDAVMQEIQFVLPDLMTVLRDTCPDLYTLLMSTLNMGY